METCIPPSKALDYFARNYPNIWKRVDRAREGRKRADPRWPKWCYLPQSHARAIMAHYGPFNLPDEVRAEISRGGHLDPWEVNYGSTLMTKYLARSLALLAGWRHTKGIYRFDPDVYQELINTPLDRALPSERLLRLPEWCVAIETPGLLAKGDPRSHVLVTVSLDDDTPQILIGCNIVPAIRLRLANTSIVDALAEARYRGVAEDVARPLVQVALPLALYLCSDDADLSAGEDRTKNDLVKTTKGMRLIPPRQVQQWDVGSRVGSTLRLLRAELDALAPESDPEPPVETQEGGPGRARPRPHVRRAHWHTYWTGPRDDPSARRSVVKWVPPVLVNARSSGDLVTTLHPVDEESSKLLPS